MSFLDEVNSSIATNDQKNEIIAKLNAFIDETKKLYLEATYQSLKDAIMTKAKQLSSSSFDGIFTVFAMKRKISTELKRKIYEYGLLNTIDDRFVAYKYGSDDIYFPLGTIKEYTVTVQETETYYKKFLFFKKEHSYTINKQKEVLCLESTFRDVINDLIHLAKNDGIHIDTSSIFLGKRISNYIDSSKGTVLFLNDLFESPPTNSTCTFFNAENHYFLRDVDSSSVKVITNMKEFCDNQRLYCKAETKHSYNIPHALQEMCKKDGSFGFCEIKYSNSRFTHIALQLKYSING